MSLSIDKTKEIIQKHLYFFITRKKLKDSKSVLYITIDDEYRYKPYFHDFGPYNISYVYKFCNKLMKNLQGNRKLVYYTSTHPEKKTNAAFLMGSFIIIHMGLNADDAYQLIKFGEPYREFVDAIQHTSVQTIDIYNCLAALEKAIQLNFFNIKDFNDEEYDEYDKLKNGNLNWVVPRKFIAFLGPSDEEGVFAHNASFYLKFFKENDVKTVIRLNNKLYDSNVFTHSGIKHYDLFFNDGTVPSTQILTRFFKISETTPGPIAIHCKAGLGRTGTLIACHLIKHYDFTAKEAIGWLRLCRPGSVIGIQQLWLQIMEPALKKDGFQYRLTHFRSRFQIPRHTFGIYSYQWSLQRKDLEQKSKRMADEIRVNNTSSGSMDQVYFANLTKLLTSFKQLKLERKQNPNTLIHNFATQTCCNTCDYPSSNSNYD